jgi:hypothetical protein
MSKVTTIQFTPSTTNTDGTTMSAADQAALKYTAYIDTVNPPKAAYQIPAAALTKITNPVANGPTVQALFSALTPPFVPADGTAYWVALTETDAEGSSAQTTPVTFTNTSVPNSPLALTLV